MSIDGFGRLTGSIELIVAALLAVKPWFPKASVVGAVIAWLFFVTTLSFMITTPGVGEASAGGFPVLSADGGFLMKDGSSLWLLADASTQPADVHWSQPNVLTFATHPDLATVRSSDDPVAYEPKR